MELRSSSQTSSSFSWEMSVVSMVFGSNVILHLLGIKAKDSLTLV